MITFKTAIATDVEILALLSRVTYVESHGHFIDDKKDLFKYCEQAYSIKKTAEDLNDKSNLFYIVYVDELPVGYSKIVLNYPFENKTSNPVSYTHLTLPTIYSV